jgi:hypothetical protein
MSKDAAKQQLTNEQQLTKALNTGFGPDELLWKCQARLKFLTTLALEEPELVKTDRVFCGFRETLLDVENMLGLVVEQLDKEESL